MILILLASVFGWWGKLTRCFLKHSSGSYSNAENRRLKEQIEAADKNIGKENSFYVYRDYIEIKNSGARTVALNEDIRRITLGKTKFGFFALIELNTYETLKADAVIPLSDEYILREIFGDKLNVVKPEKTKKRRMAMSNESKSDFERTSFDGNRRTDNRLRFYSTV